MVKDGIFRIRSMTRPDIGAATLMMMEEGKIGLRIRSRVDPRVEEHYRGRGVAGWARVCGCSRGRAGGSGAGRATRRRPSNWTSRSVILQTHVNGLVTGPISQSANRAVAAKADEMLADYIPRLGTRAAVLPAGHALGL